jgi:thioredoxin-dependent peroxiredoxin
MAKITFKGNPVSTSGDLPRVGAPAPDFTLVKNDLGATSLKDYAGKNLVLNIFPSIDTGVCATSVRRFNQEASELPNTTVLCVSMDLPFAQKRFCGAEGIDRVSTASAFRGPDFGAAYGVTMKDGPLAGLFARAVVVVDEDGKVVHSQLVPEIAQEPDYAAAIATIV